LGSITPHRQSVGHPRPPERQKRPLARRPLFPWRRVGARQLRHARAARPRAGGAVQRRRRLRELQPIPGGEIPDGRRTNLCAAVGRIERREVWARSEKDLPRRRQRRWEHDRGRGAYGEGARRTGRQRHADVLSGHGRRLRHAVLPPLR